MSGYDSDRNRGPWRRNYRGPAPARGTRDHDVTGFTLEVSTENAAFDDDPAAELCRILRDVADAIEGGADEGTIRDANGNTVGRWEAT